MIHFVAYLKLTQHCKSIIFKKKKKKVKALLSGMGAVACQASLSKGFSKQGYWS